MRLQKTFAVVSILFALLGLGVFAAFIGDATGAPQEAALSAMVLAVVIPVYVIARGVEMLGNAQRSR